MKMTFTIAHLLLRLAGLSAIVMGLLFWNNLALNLIPFHMLAGVVVVLALWTLALLAARAGAHPLLVGIALVWGLIVPTLGIMQNQLLPNASHWVIQVLHLLVGVLALWQGEGLAAHVQRAQPLLSRTKR